MPRDRSHLLREDITRGTKLWHFSARPTAEPHAYFTSLLLGGACLDFVMIDNRVEDSPTPVCSRTAPSATFCVANTNLCLSLASRGLSCDLEVLGLVVAL
eukprot:2289327-Amphidinium_carterae.2